MAVCSWKTVNLLTILIDYYYAKNKLSASECERLSNLVQRAAKTTNPEEVAACDLAVELFFDTIVSANPRPSQSGMSHSQGV